jgi:predicted Zn-dependent protease
MADSPTYYTRGKIECWDFIRDQQLNYHLGCAIKYICRAGYKNSAVSDLKKAIHYLENELENTQDDSIGSSKRVSGRLLDLGFDEWATDPEIFDR